MRELYHRRAGLSSATFTPGRGFWYNVRAMASHIPPKNMLFACFSADPGDASAPEMPASFLPDRESPALCWYDLAELVESYARRIVLPLFPASPQEALRSYSEDGRRIVPSVPHLQAGTGSRPSMSVGGSAYDEVLVELVSYLVNLACLDVYSAKAAANWTGLRPDGYLGTRELQTWFADPDIRSSLGSSRREDAEESLAVTQHFPRESSTTWGKFTLYVNRASRQGTVPEHGMDFPVLADRIVDTETATVNLGPGLGSVRLPKDSLVWAYDGDGSRFDDEGHVMLEDSFRATEGPEADKSGYDGGRRIGGGAYLPLAADLGAAYLPREAHYDPDRLHSSGNRYYAEIGPAAYESVPYSPGSSQYRIPDSAGLPASYSSLPPRSVGLGAGHVVAFGGHDWKAYYGYTYVRPRPWGPSAKSYWDANPGLKDTSGLPQAIAHLWREPLPLGAYPNTATGARYDVARTPVLLSPALLTRADARVDPSKSYVDAVTQTPGHPLEISRTGLGSAAWFPDSLDPRTLLDELYRWRDEHLKATVTVVEMAVAASAAFDRRSAFSESTATDRSVTYRNGSSQSYTDHDRSATGRKDVESLEASDFAVSARGSGRQTGSPYASGSGGSLSLPDLLRAPLLRTSMQASGSETDTRLYGSSANYDETTGTRTKVEATAYEGTGAPRVSGLTPVHRGTVQSGGLGGGTMRYESGTSYGSVSRSWRNDEGEEPDMSPDGVTADPETTYDERTSGRHLPLIPDWMAPAVLKAELYAVVRAETRRTSDTWQRYEAGTPAGGISSMLQKDIGSVAAAAAARTTVMKLSEYDPATGRFTGDVTAEDVAALYPPLPEQAWAGDTPAAAKGWVLASGGMRTLGNGAYNHRYMYDGAHGSTQTSAENPTTFHGGYVYGSHVCADEDPSLEDSSYMLLVVEWDFDTPLPLDGSPASCMEYLLDAKRRTLQALEALEAAAERADEAEALFAEADTSTDFTYIRDQEDLDELESSRRVRAVWSDDAPFSASGAAKAWAALQEAAGPGKTEGLKAGIDELKERLEADAEEIENTIAELEEEMEDPEYEDDPSRCKPTWARSGAGLSDARKLMADAVRMLRDAKREDGVLRAESAAIVSRYDSLRSSNHPDEWRPYANGRPVWMYDAAKDVQFTALGTMESLFGRTGDSRQVMGSSGAYWVVMSSGVAMYLPALSDASGLPSQEMADVPLVFLGRLG